MDMSSFSVAATHQTHLLVGPPSDVRAIIRVRASGLGEHGVDVSLRLWTPLGATLTVLRERERAPAARDLGDRAIRFDDRTAEYPAGRWTDGAREYELAIALPAGRAGDEMLAARFSVVVGDEVAGRARIAVTWTDDERIAAASRSAGPTRTDAEAVADLPTGPSPKPRHTLAVESPAACPACDLCAGDGDRFCERCGHELTGA
jgi:hypothetical protein